MEAKDEQSEMSINIEYFIIFCCCTVCLVRLCGAQLSTHLVGLFVSEFLCRVLYVLCLCGRHIRPRYYRHLERVYLLL